MVEPPENINDNKFVNTAMQKTVSDYPLLLLCAGKSSRMGSPKGLLLIDGVPWFQHHIEQFRRAGGTHAVVVFGYNFESYLAALNCNEDDAGQWIDRFGMEVGVVVNPRPEFGQFSSIQCGLKQASQDKFPGIFVLPVDMPSPTKGVWESLSENMPNTLNACVPSFQGKAGHPVLLARRIWDSLTTLAPEAAESRLDRQMGLLPEDTVRYIDVDDASVLKNINTKTEFDSIES